MQWVWRMHMVHYHIQADEQKHTKLFQLGTICPYSFLLPLGESHTKKTAAERLQMLVSVLQNRIMFQDSPENWENLLK